MTKIEFSLSNSEWGQRVEINCSMNVVIDDLMKFAHEQFPKMCGPIHVEQDGQEMCYDDATKEWIPYYVYRRVYNEVF